MAAFQLPPYSALKAAWDVIPGLGNSGELESKSPVYKSPDGELLRYAFTREVFHPTLTAPVTSLEEIFEFYQSIHTPTELFYDGAQHVEIIEGRQLEIDDVSPVIVVDFLFDGQERKAYAYGSLENLDGATVLIIPGSGDNKARSIATGERDDYHCCLWNTLAEYARFVQIKPNEDLRAIHNGVGRLNEDFFINWQINTGSSYSAAYTIEAVALSRFLAQQSQSFALVGLSQGAKAALLVSLLEAPDALVVAAGYSVVHHRLTLWSGHRQFLIPGMYAFTAPNRLVEEINFPALFSYGRLENGSYRIDADTGLTCEALKPNSRITCLVHDGGHNFPEPEVLAFLDMALRKS